MNVVLLLTWDDLSFRMNCTSWRVRGRFKENKVGNKVRANLVVGLGPRARRKVARRVFIGAFGTFDMFDRLVCHGISGFPLRSPGGPQE